MATKKTKGRPRSFDTDVVLDQITETFWRFGFGATTYEALELATGLGRQSLIYAFGDKTTMFLKALDYYTTTRVSAVCHTLSHGATAKECIRSAFDLWLADARCRKHRGCLMVTTAGEIGPNDRVTSDKISVARQKLVAAFASTFQRACEEGTLASSNDPFVLADLAVSTGDGALLYARNKGTSNAAELSINGLFNLIFK